MIYKAPTSIRNQGANYPVYKSEFLLCDMLHASMVNALHPFIRLSITLRLSLKG